MKQLVTAFFVVFTSFGALAQINNPFPKTIQVTGSAESEIIPDEIYVIVTLKEYEKKGTKFDLEKIKKDFIGYCRSIGLPDSSVTIASYEGYNNYPWWRRKRMKTELYASISYQVKFTTSKKMDELVEKLDDDATHNFVIARLSHSKMPELRRELKIKAIKAAKEKGMYLAEAIGEKLGDAVTITEPDEFMQPELYRASVGNAYAALDQAKWNVADGEKGIDFKNIKLRFEVKAVFALK